MLWFIILFFLVMAFIAHANDKKAKQAAELQHSTLKVTIESEERVIHLTLQPESITSSLQFDPISLWLKQDEAGQWILDESQEQHAA